MHRLLAERQLKYVEDFNLSLTQISPKTTVFFQALNIGR
jgi:hypothetical protein